MHNKLYAIYSYHRPTVPTCSRQLYLRSSRVLCVIGKYILLFMLLLVHFVYTAEVLNNISPITRRYVVQICSYMRLCIEAIVLSILSCRSEPHMRLNIILFFVVTFNDCYNNLVIQGFSVIVILKSYYSLLFFISENYGITNFNDLILH